MKERKKMRPIKHTHPYILDLEGTYLKEKEADDAPVSVNSFETKVTTVDTVALKNSQELKYVS